MMEWLKADFHLHSGEDRLDIIPYPAWELIDRCARLGYKVISITNHQVFTFEEHWRDYAQERGILLIPGVEANINGRHVLILNADGDANRLQTFEDLAAYRMSHNVVIVAPHPFHWSLICLRARLESYLSLFDAIEIHSFYTKRFDPNRKAQQFAEANGVPLVANSDCHHLSQLDRTYSRVFADMNVASVLNSLRKGDVQIVTEPLDGAEVLRLLIYLRIGQAKRLLRRLNRRLLGSDREADVIMVDGTVPESQPLHLKR